MGHNYSRDLRPAKWGPIGHSAKQQFSKVHVRFGSKADIAECLTDVRYSPESRHRETLLECPLSAKSGHMQRGKKALFDHLVGGRKQRLRNVELKRLCSLEIYDEREFGHLLNRNIRRLFSFEDFVDKLRRTAVHLLDIRSVRQQYPGLRKRSDRRDAGKAKLCSDLDNLLPQGDQHRSVQYHKTCCAGFGCGRQTGRNVVGG